MKIIECYVENFGKISKQRFDFREGLNCIVGDNGWGKTTLAAFIKVMFYGMSDTKKTNLDENDRKHYLPWSGGACGGSLTFNAGGKTYRVERSFAPKAADDSFALYDTSTGRICADFPEVIGESLFGIDADGFERTVFLSERALTPKSDNKSISAKLSDLVGCDGDIGGMDEAMKLLEERRKFYHKKGGSGELADVKAQIDELTRRLGVLDKIEGEVELCHKKMKDISEQIQSARAEAKIILAEREKATLRAAEVNYEKQYKEMKASLEDSNAKRTAVCQVFGADIPSFDDINEASYKSIEAKKLMESATDTPEIREFKTLSAKFDGKVDKELIDQARTACDLTKKNNEKKADPRLNKAKRIFCGRVPEESELDSIEEVIKNDQIKHSTVLAAGLFLSILVAVIGIMFNIVVVGVGVVLAVVFALILALSKNKKTKDRQQKIEDFFTSVSGVKPQSDEEARARLADMRELVSVIKDNSPIDTESYERVLRELTMLFPEKTGDIISSAEAIIKEYDRYAELAVAERYMAGDRMARSERSMKLKSDADAFLQRFNTRSTDPFGELRSALTEYERLTAEIVAKRNEISKLESLYKLGEGSQRQAAMDIEMLDRKRQENEKTVADLSREFTLTERLYLGYIDELDGRDELIMRRDELEEILAKHKDNYETVMLTKKYITQAKDNLTVRYLGKTKAGFVKYAEKIGGITGESFEMDTDFGVTKQEGGTTKATEAYSRGTRDLFNLAARLALVDSLYEKEKPFIILDDPFTAFDDGKTDAAIKLLKEFAKERQIIYFTCAKSRSIKS